MTKKDAKSLLKQSGKTDDEINAIYDKHTSQLGYTFTGLQWNTAIRDAFAEAAGIPATFELKGPTVNAIAVLMDQ